MTEALFSRTGVRYEVALEILGSIIAHHAEAIATEEAAPAPDADAIAAYEKVQDELRTLQHELRADDAAAIERVIGQYGPQARALNQR